VVPVAVATLDDLVRVTLDEIRSVAGGYEKVYVMFSGGKDSLATLDLAVKALGREGVEALFIDTGIATPGLRDYVVDVAGRYGVKLNVVRPEHDFFELVSRAGFPMIRYRWCKDYLKMRPLKRFVREAEGRHGSILLVTGLRRDESWMKARGSKFYRHPRLGTDVYAPIFEWSGEQVREYIRREGLPENPLYRVYGKAYDCWCTVFKSPADFALLALNRPDFFAKFVEAEAKLRSGGSALYYGGERVYLRDIARNPQEYLKRYPQNYKCPFCRVLM
jgi:phosphoadenosine phosphosulfate reductase